jgi:hypothetical protein
MSDLEIGWGVTTPPFMVFTTLVVTLDEWTLGVYY